MSSSTEQNGVIFVLTNDGSSGGVGNRCFWCALRQYLLYYYPVSQAQYDDIVVMMRDFGYVYGITGDGLGQPTGVSRKPGNNPTIRSRHTLQNVDIVAGNIDDCDMVACERTLQRLDLKIVVTSQFRRETRTNAAIGTQDLKIITNCDETFYIGAPNAQNTVHIYRTYNPETILGLNNVNGNLVPEQPNESITHYELILRCDRFGVDLHANNRSFMPTENEKMMFYRNCFPLRTIEHVDLIHNIKKYILQLHVLCSLYRSGNHNRMTINHLTESCADVITQILMSGTCNFRPEDSNDINTLLNMKTECINAFMREYIYSGNYPVLTTRWIGSVSILPGERLNFLPDTIVNGYQPDPINGVRPPRIPGFTPQQKQQLCDFVYGNVTNLWNETLRIMRHIQYNASNQLIFDENRLVKTDHF